MEVVLSRPGPSRRRRTGAGFSLLEVLIALGLMALLLGGVLQLFTRSMWSNVEGQFLTQATNEARQRAEQLMDLPFNSLDLTIPDGDTELVVLEHLTEGGDRWHADGSVPDGEAIEFSRRIRVRQYQATAVDGGDQQFEVSEALVGGTTDSMVDVKEIVVWVSIGAWPNSEMAGRRKVAVVRVLRTV